MNNIFSISKSGMNAYQEKLDYIANDLANMSTTGYKSTDIGFKDLLTETLDRKGTPLNDKTAVNGTGVRTGINYSKNTQGNLLNTGGKTDLAIDGEGYFAIYQGDGTIAYTRDGNLKVDANGTLVDALGNKVYIQYAGEASEGEPALKADDLSINQNGEISMKIGEEMVDIGKIPLFTAIGDKSFIPIGNNYFVPTEDAQVTESTDYDIIQGMLEGSNVNVGEAFTDMILSQRAFQLNSKAISVADDLWGMINSMR